MKKLLSGIVALAAVVAVMTVSGVPAQADTIIFPPGPSVPTTAQQ